MERVAINQEVIINSMYFKNKEQLEAFPKRMEFMGETYVFLNSGWRYLVHKGKEVVRIFNMSDGYSNFRLKLDSYTGSWTLLEITPTEKGLSGIHRAKR